MFTDSHCHLDFKEFDAHRDELIEQCAKADIHRFIVPGITAKTWPRVLQLCSTYKAALPSLGLHPWWIDKATPEDLLLLEQLLDKHKNTIVAVGEIGIDGGLNKGEQNIAKQSQYFVQQLNIAKQHNLPVIVHHRKSHHLIIPLLQKIALAQGGVIHAFSGSYQQAKSYIDLGFKLGIGGTITYPRASKTLKAVSRIPLEHIVLETDAPAMPLNGFQGQHNSPINIPIIFEQLCKIRQESVAEIKQQIEQNIESLFNKTKIKCE